MDNSSRAPALNNPNFRDLRARYLASELVIFAGSGVSQGLPSWAALIQQVIAKAQEHSLDPSVRAALERAQQRVERHDLIAALSILEQTLAPPLFVRLVQAALDDRPLEIPDTARALAELHELRAVLTTNLDRFLERAFAGQWPHYIDPTLDLGGQKGYILKLHGTRESSETWVLTRRQYEALIHRRPATQSFLKSLYLQRTLLFIGYGLRDPDFELLLGWIRSFAGNHPPRHFALMLADSVDPEDCRDLARAGIEIIPYASHDELPHLLRALRGAPPPAPTPEPPPAPRSPAQEAPMSDLHPNERLANLFKDLFNSTELRRLIARVQPGLDGDLSESARLNDLVFEAAEVLMRHGLVARTLDLAAAARPERKNEIDALRACFSRR